MVGLLIMLAGGYQAVTGSIRRVCGWAWVLLETRSRCRC